jgi:opacity protein-like surface antigen
MRIVTFLLIILLLILSSAMSHASNHPVKARFGLSLTPGLAFPSRPCHHFEYGLTNVKTHPRFAYSGGLVYGPLKFFSTINVIISAEVSSIETGTDQTAIENMSGGSAEMSIEVISAMLWTTFIANDRLSPFVRLGLGVSRVRFSELYEPPSLEDTEIEYQEFTWGAGAGINYFILPQLSASIFTDVYLIDGEHLKERKGGRTTGIYQRVTQVLTGLRITYSL